MLVAVQASRVLLWLSAYLRGIETRVPQMSGDGGQGQLSAYLRGIETSIQTGSPGAFLCYQRT